MTCGGKLQVAANRESSPLALATVRRRAAGGALQCQALYTSHMFHPDRWSHTPPCQISIRANACKQTHASNACSCIYLPSDSLTYYSTVIACYLPTDELTYLRICSIFRMHCLLLVRNCLLPTRFSVCIPSRLTYPPAYSGASCEGAPITIISDVSSASLRYSPKSTSACASTCALRRDSRPPEVLNQ